MRDMTGAVVVGYDGSSHSAAAVDWATAEAQRRGAELVVLHASDLTRVVGPAGRPGWVAHTPREGALRVVEEGVSRVRKLTTDLKVDGVAEVSGAAAALERASRTAELVVLGKRGHGNLTGSLLGSVTFSVTTHSYCPVVVVRGGQVVAPGPDRSVVVGVDGSPGSHAAVEYAAAYAEQAGASLQLVTGWTMPAAESWAAEYWTTIAPDSQTHPVLEGAEQVLAQARDAVLASYPDLLVVTRAVQGDASQVLTAASRGAALVVVGARGRGGFASLLLGSVSRGVIHSAESPVLVLRHRDREEGR